ncbi:ABC transporter substrate-binding protein [Bosea sp. 2KB_26]|uniref:ABC transporter substrate-binding protein n=1 Tax=Bosea sp. 2KB_26 TaxID=3237475 RepID=UPI003F8DDFD0
MKVAWLAALAALACPMQALAQVPKQGGELRIALSTDITSSEPGVRRSGDSDTILHHVLEALVAYREDLTIAPLLAESYTIGDGGRSYSFTLRDGITFHNGAPMSSADVKWSWDRLLDPATKWQCRGWYDGSQDAKIEAIETPDARTVVFRLAAPSALFLHYVANVQCLTGILHKDSVGPNGEWRQPVGTGPFTFAEWRKNSFILLKKFAGYRPRSEPMSGYAGARLAHVDQVRWMVVPDDATRRTALRAGQIDWIVTDVSDVVELRAAKGVRVSTAQGLSWNVLLVQTRDPLFADIRVRRALAHAIDLKTLVETRTDGLGKPNPSAIPDSSSAHTAVHGKGYAYDPDLARRLLKEAGYDGRPIKLQTSQKLAHLYDTAIILQSMLKQAGFNVDLEVLEWATQLDRYSKGNFQLQSFRFTARLEPSLNYKTIVGSKDVDPDNQWEDPQAIALLSSSTAELDPGRRQAIFDELHLRMIDQAPIVSLYNTPLVEASTDRVDGIGVTGFGKMRAWGVWITR